MTFQATAVRRWLRVLMRAFGMALLLAAQAAAAQSIPVAHVYHNHMPNFWPYYANSNAEVIAKYDATRVGDPIRYLTDGEVIKLKLNPPAGYPYWLPSTVGTGPMPHDDLVTYYSHHAKYQCYQSYPPGFGLHGWPMASAEQMQGFAGGNGQVHVTFSGSLATNVNGLELGGAIPGFYNNGSAWNTEFVNDVRNLKTNGGYQTLDMLHFTAHHSLGPLVGREYFLKDLIAHGATLAQPWFLGSNYKSSRGFFPTELSFSTRLVPELAKLGVQWTVVGNNHFSHALTDYPYADYDARLDANTSPPNRADLRNTSTIGSWVIAPMTNQEVSIVNKYPFASTPHWVRQVDPFTGAVSKLAAIPASQNGQWEEGFNGQVTVAEYLPYASLEPRQYYVLAHDGDNSMGRSGSWETWSNGTTVTGSGNGYNLGVDEYLKKFPIPATDVVHVQDGSWADVLDASSDPMFYHWHQPFLIWTGQFKEFNKTTGLALAPKKNLRGVPDEATVTFEYGWHYQELAYAKLQPALNFAITAEQNLARQPPHPLVAHHRARRAGHLRRQPAQPLDDRGAGEG
ncbi:MAG: hypothetical protein QM767_23405 [Anaeromyxobacter sp.]